MTPNAKEHSFSVEMSSRDSLNNVSVSDSPFEGVLIQGELGGLVGITIIEDVTLEVRGDKGTLRLDLTRNEMANLLQDKKD
jgi:hypothetical protein